MTWHRRALNVLRSGRLRRDLERELSFHLRERVDELKTTGVGEREATDIARRQFGHYQSHVEHTRDVDVSQRLEAAVQNVRFAARALSRAPAFSITAVLTLALAIGANSAVFSALDAVVLRPLPFPNAEQLVRLTQSTIHSAEIFVAPTRLEDWNRFTKTFQGITGYYANDVSEVSGELPERLTEALVAPRFLDVWQIAPIIGRTFNRAEEQFGGPPAVLISERFWRRRFGADPAAVGKSLRFGATPFTIVGVLPASFLFPVPDTDVWMVSCPDAPYAQNRKATWFTAIGRLKAGATVAEARADLATVQAALGKEYPETDSDVRAVVEPLKDVTVGGARQSLWILFASVSLLLLIACANIAGLLLARAAARQHEVAVRVALGASRSSVAGYLLTEILLLALAGAAGGILIAAAGCSVFRTLAGNVPRVGEIALNWRTVAYSLGCAVVCAAACALVPLLRVSRRTPMRTLVRQGRSQLSSRNRVQFILVGVQVALAVTLLAAAGLLVRSVQELGRVSPGFDPSRVLTFHVTTSWGETADPEASRRRAQRILDAMQSIPEVRAASTTAFSLPGVPSDYQVDMRIVEGQADPHQRVVAQVRSVSRNYFATMRIPLVAGEVCRDDAGQAAVMVNSSFARLYLNGLPALGRHLLQPGNPNFPVGDIRGVVGDARETGLDRGVFPTVYLCWTGLQPNTYFLVRTAGDPNAVSQAIRRRLQQVEPHRSVYATSLLTQHIAGAYAENRMRTILLAFFALASVSLACVGLYGTLSYLVTVRQREMALRLAVGASRGQVIREVLTRGLRVALLGGAAGLVLAAASTRLLTGMLFGVSRADPLTVTGVILLVLVVSALASLVPALRAARLDPMRLLREE